MENIKKTYDFLIRTRLADVFFIVCLLLLIAVYLVRYLYFDRPPTEDAAILMRYAEHLAQGQGIVWNIGEPPVDGATDFLFMVVLAGLVKIGLTVESAVRLVDITAHALTVVLVYLAIRWLYGSGRWLAFVSAAILAVGPGLHYAEVYFGTPFFALLVALTWCFASRLAIEQSTRFMPVLFAVSALLMGLTRPEGVLLAIIFLAAVVYMRGIRHSLRTISFFMGTFLIAGGAYFLWRWSYFGYPLPNPYYKKGSELIYIGSLQGAIKNVITLSLPILPVYLIAGMALVASWLTRNRWIGKIELLRYAGGQASRKESSQAINPEATMSNPTAELSYKRLGGFNKIVIFTLMPVLCFTALWVLLSSEMNFLMRFQYPLLPVMLISWPFLLIIIKERLFEQGWKFPSIGILTPAWQITMVAFIAAVSLGVLMYQHNIGTSLRYFPDGRYELALSLREYKDRNYTMAVTEAGLLPLYSEWKTIDTWGLNDEWIAHHGGITEEYLEQKRPELIFFHEYFSPLVPPGNRVTKSKWEKEWFGMVMTLKEYAEKNGYILAAVFGDSPYDTHYYYVRPDFSESAAIVEKIRSANYPWFATGKKSIDYNLFVPDSFSR